VVDNASSDGSVEMVRSEFPQVRVIVEKSNLGYAGAVNEGIVASTSRYVLVLNSDTLICDSAIEKTVHYADKHPAVAVVGCQVFDERGVLGMSCFRFPSILNLALDTFWLNKIFRNNSFFDRELIPEWARDSEREIDVIEGMFMLVRRQAIDAVGLMDESFFFFFEETDWCYRFAKAGWKMRFWPGAKIVHVHGGGQSQKKAGIHLAVQYPKNLLIFFRKHYGWADYFLARVLLTFRSGCRCVLWGILRLYRALIIRNAQYERQKMQVYWWSFWYCVFGLEPSE
jgi:GT2 family glycosyltransferase